MNLFSELFNILTDINLLEWTFIAFFIWCYPTSFYELIIQILTKRRLEMGDIGQVEFFATGNSRNEMDRTGEYILGDKPEMSVYDSGGDDSFSFLMFEVPDSF